MADVDGAIAELRASLRAGSDAEMATMLGLGRSAVSQWRRRGAIPTKVRMRAAEVVQHLDHYTDARAKLAALPRDVEVAATAVAIAYAYRHADAEGRRQSDWLLRWASAFDQVRLAAALLVVEEVRVGGMSASFSAETLLESPTLDRRMTEALLP